LETDTGTNSFLVSAQDASGLSNTATMYIYVGLPTAIISTLRLEGTDLLLSWSGGSPPFTVEKRTDLTNSLWEPVAGPIGTNVLTIYPTNQTEFYRVLGQ
jgi:hypothetical protein